jgi:hypothetical protein
MRVSVTGLFFKKIHDVIRGRIALHRRAAQNYLDNFFFIDA